MRRRAAIWTALLVGALCSPAVAFSASMPPSLLADARANPEKTFRVIVYAPRLTRLTREEVAEGVQRELDKKPSIAHRMIRRFHSVAGTSAVLSGEQLVGLAEYGSAGMVVVPDAPLVADSLSSRQQWPYVVGVARSWSGVTNGTLQMPTIAIVDSGIDAARADFGARVLEQVDFTSLAANSPGDGRGHGTFVSGIAAGEASGYTGAAPGAKLVSLDVMDDSGMALTSDLLAACDWILANKDRLGIRVVNFSLHSAAPASVLYSPMNRAVERLWFAGIVVVASAGNYGQSSTPQTMAFAPGNDPFVITVGATDTEGSVSANDDFAAPWSAFGYTLDGFLKPDISAPGRYLMGPVPTTSTLYSERPDRIVAPGYMQISGTSFAAPVVAGAAAYLLALHPTWTPDQVKGALMLTAKPTPAAVPLSAGVGEVNAARAADVVDPPNPNAALAPFVVPDPNGGLLPVFDAPTWQGAALADANWSTANWSTANWSTANWSTANWSTANWSTANWSTANWSTANWADGGDTFGSDANWADNAEGDFRADGGYLISDADLAAALAEYGETP